MGLSVLGAPRFAPIISIHGTVVGEDSSPRLSIDELRFEPGLNLVAGPNGGGKSTLLQLLAGVTGTSWRGQVGVGSTVHETDKSLRRIRPMLGYAPQRLQFLAGFRVNEFVEYLLLLRGYDTARARSTAESALAQLDIQPLAHKKMGQLSGGQLQRANLAQSLAHRPSLLLLDEPTAALDEASRLNFYSLITEVSAQCTVLMCTHVHEDLNLPAESITRLKDGKVVPS